MLTIGRAGMDQDRRINRLDYQRPGETILHSGVSFDGLGRVKQVEGLIDGGVRDYGYTVKGELSRSSEWRPGASGMEHRETLQYGYDVQGNRAEVNRRESPGLDGSEGALIANLQQITYGRSNRMESVTIGGMTTLADHDEAGHVTLNPVKHQRYVWDDEGNLSEIHYLGVDNDKELGSTRFFYDGVSQLKQVQELDRSGVITDDVSYVWVGGRPIQKRETATGRLLESYNGEEQTLYAADGTLTRYFLLKDYLGSVVAKTDVSGNILERIDYDAYGQRKQRQVRDASGTLIDADIHTTTLPFGYAGYFEHQRSGLNLTRFRAYDASLGRWLSKDPIAELGGLNLYQYVNGNPVSATDPLGLTPQLLLAVPIALGQIAVPVAVAVLTVATIYMVTAAVVAHFSAEELLKRRDEVRQEIAESLKASLVSYNIVMEDIQITNFKFSPSFDHAIEEKQTAEQQALKAKNDLERIKVEAEQKITLARAEALTIQIQAQAIKEQGGTEYVQLKAIEKWNGQLPQVTSGNTTLINLKEIK